MYYGTDTLRNRVHSESLSAPKVEWNGYGRSREITDVTMRQLTKISVSPLLKFSTAARRSQLGFLKWTLLPKEHTPVKYPEMWANL
ncbi:hypothetical protein PHISP_02449 [Aspergillus sp. HF37]|nr:hypothetical protein PHISP_02449 [Aspergillus sp. HF37]